jgi:hypothetical protein
MNKGRLHFEKSMKTRMNVNERYFGRTEVVLSRRFGSAWFLIQTASLARDQRNQRLLRAMRNQRVELVNQDAAES